MQKFGSLAALLTMLVATAAPAQYPTKPVRIVVPIPPGGAPDIAARIVGQKLGERLGQQVIAENRAGANGNVAMELVAKATPDGYTLLLGADSMIAINPHLYRKMPIDTLKDLVPVSSIAANQFVLSVHPSLPVRTLQEFVDHARKANPPLAYASGGNGSQHQMAMEMLKQRAGINLTHVPYKGGSPATTATVAGETLAMFAGTSSSPQIRAGKLRALASTGTKRSAAFPDLPTIAETYPGYEVTIWLGLFSPATPPDAVMTRLRNDIQAVLATADVKEKLNAGGGLDPYAASPEEFSALIRRDYDKYGKLVKDVGITVD
jgi:tripartite-type tricarboxylate transporter receptor subunit TctC